MYHLWKNPSSKIAHLLPPSSAAVLLRPSCELLSVFAQLMGNPLRSDFSLLQCLSHDSENWSCWHVCFMRKFFTWFASIFFQRRADDVSAVFVMAARFLSRLGWLPDLRWKEMPTVTPCYDPQDYPRKLHVKHYEFHLGFFLTKFHFYCMIAGHCTRSDSSQFLLSFQGSVLQNRTMQPANTHTVLFTEVWLITVAKIRTIASSYWPCKCSVQNFWNDLRMIPSIQNIIREK